MAKQMVPITNGTDNCSTYKDCLDMIKAGKKIHYNGKSGMIQFWDAGDPTSATIGVYQFGPDNTLLPDVTYQQGEIVPDGAANPIEGKPQDGANDGTFKVGTFLPVTGNLAFLGPPMFAGVDLAAKEIEAAGGPIKLANVLPGDSGDTTTDIASQTADSHIAAGVTAIFGAAS